MNNNKNTNHVTPPSSNNNSKDSNNKSLLAVLEHDATLATSCSSQCQHGSSAMQAHRLRVMEKKVKNMEDKYKDLEAKGIAEQAAVRELVETLLAERAADRAAVQELVEMLLAERAADRAAVRELVETLLAKRAADRAAERELEKERIAERAAERELEKERIVLWELELADRAGERVANVTNNQTNAGTVATVVGASVKVEEARLRKEVEIEQARLRVEELRIHKEDKVNADFLRLLGDKVATNPYTAPAKKDASRQSGGMLHQDKEPLEAESNADQENVPSSSSSTLTSTPVKKLRSLVVKLNHDGYAPLH
jgi:hypothetical protein